MDRIGAPIATSTFWVGVAQWLNLIPEVVGVVVGLIGAVASIFIIRKTDAMRKKLIAEEHESSLKSEKLQLEIDALKQSQSKIISK